MKKITLILALAGTLVSLDASAQKCGKTEQDSIDCIMNNSLYVESFKQKQYADAYEPWKKVVEVCPQYHINTFIRGNTILQYMYKTATTAEQREKYFNEMLSLYDTRSEAFGEKWNNIARKAGVYETYKPTETTTIYNLYKEAQEEADKNNAILGQSFCVKYLQATINYLRDTKASSEEMAVMFDVYDYASTAMEQSKTETANALDAATQLNDTKKMEKLQKEYNSTINNIAALETLIEPFASCDKIVPIYESRFEKSPNDVALLKKITTAMSSKGCTDQELFFKATENLHKAEPTPKTAFLMGQMLIGKKQFSEAAKYLEEAEKTSTDVTTKAKASYKLAEALMFAKSYSAARSAARRSADYDKSLQGKCTLMVARMYLATGGREAAWAAYDEAARAKAQDPSIAGDAQRVMSSAAGRFPAKDTLFFEGLNAGTVVGVGGWIGGSTTVKTR